MDNAPPKGRPGGQFLPPLDGGGHQALPQQPAYGRRGRLIVDEVEAHDIMSHVYRSDAAELSGMALAHTAQTARHYGTRGGRAPIRELGNLIYRAASMDPNTRLQKQLNFSNNRDLQDRPYTQGGGFVAKEISRFVPPSQRDPAGKFVGSGRDVEFHPPGGRHNAGHYLDLHGSYLRPATQPNQSKPRQRSFSVGARVPDH